MTLNIIVRGLLVCSLALSSCKSKVKKELPPPKTMEQTETPPVAAPLQKKLTSPTVSVLPHTVLRSPQKIRVNSQGVWFASEGELGWARLLTADGKLLTEGILKAEGDWMIDAPAMFSTVLSFKKPKTKTGTLVIIKNTGEGDGDEAGTPEKFEIPVRF